MSVSKTMRFEVMRRDSHTCRYCGAKAPDVKLAVDHVVPTALGGPDHPTNLVTACVECNAGKGSTAPDAPLVEDVRADALRLAAAYRQIANEDRARRAEIETAIRILTEGWDHFFGRQACLPDDAQSSLLTFAERGLNATDFANAFGVTTDRCDHRFDMYADQERTWKFFCGVCWKVIKERERLAHDLLREGGH